MVDVYMDDMKFFNIESNDTHTLMFKNDKDELLRVGIDDEQLTKLYYAVKTRCETFKLIKIRNGE